MELLDRYLQAVKTLLPKSQQNDIVKELSENILSQMEDRSTELGRPLNEAEQEAILKRHGHPVLVAGRYLPRQHLIGPAMFPFYWLTIKILLLLTVVGFAIAGITLLATGAPVIKMIETFLQFPTVALPVFGLATILFAVLDIFQLKISADWTPRSLPAVAKRARPSQRSQSISEILGGVIGILWLLAVPRFPFLMFGPAATIVKLSPVWQTVYIPILLLVAAPVAMQCVSLFRPHWTWLRPVTRVISMTISLVIINFLLKAGRLVLIEDAARKAEIVNACVVAGLVIASIVCSLTLLFEVIRLIRREGNRVLGFIS